MRHFSQVPAAMIDPDSGLTPMDVLVYIVLDLHTPNCFPGQELIAELVKASGRTVRTALSNLERGGWIVVEHRRGGGNRYRIPYRSNRKPTSYSEGDGEANRKQASGQIGNPVPIKSEAGFRLRRANEGELTKEISSSPKLRFDEADMETAKWMFSLNQQLSPGCKEPPFKSWGNTIRLLRERDHRTDEDIRALYQWAHDDIFWCSNVLCPEKLREKWDTLTVKKGNSKNGNGKSYKPNAGQVFQLDAPPVVF